MREMNKPGIFGIVGSACLAGERLANFSYCLSGAVLHYALQQGNDLVCSARVERLRAHVGQQRLGLIVPIPCIAALAGAVICTIDRVAIAVLDAIDEDRGDLLAAVDELGVPRGQADECRLISAN